MKHFESLLVAFNQFVDENSDRRTSHWLLMSSPVPVFLISIGYVIIVQVNKKFVSKSFHSDSTFMIIDTCAEIYGEPKSFSHQNDSVALQFMAFGYKHNTFLFVINISLVVNIQLAVILKQFFHTLII